MVFHLPFYRRVVLIGKEGKKKRQTCSSSVIPLREELIVTFCGRRAFRLKKRGGDRGEGRALLSDDENLRGKKNNRFDPTRKRGRKGEKKKFTPRWFELLPPSSAAKI